MLEKPIPAEIWANISQHFPTKPICVEKTEAGLLSVPITRVDQSSGQLTKKA